MTTTRPRHTVHSRRSPTSRSSTTRRRPRERSTSTRGSRNCDTTTGDVTIPILNPPPCVPAPSGDNGGATSPGVTADHDQDRLLHREARPDLRLDPEGRRRVRLARSSPRRRTRTTSTSTRTSTSCTGARSSSCRIDGTGAQHRRGRGQGRRRQGRGRRRVRGHRRSRAGAQLRRPSSRAKKILCLGSVRHRVAAVVRRSENAPYIWGTGPTPEQTALMTTELDQEPARRARTPCTAATTSSKKPRTLRAPQLRHARRQVQGVVGPVLQGPEGGGLPVVGHISYFLNLGVARRRRPRRSRTS